MDPIVRIGKGADALNSGDLCRLLAACARYWATKLQGMKLGPIDSSRIEAMAARLQAAARAQGAAAPAPVATPTAAQEGTKVTFSSSLKAMLEQVNDQQLKADGLAQRFALGDDKVNLSDVMIERQKASLSLQATVQVRNKLVNAYHEIMNMQV